MTFSDKDVSGTVDYSLVIETEFMCSYIYVFLPLLQRFNVRQSVHIPRGGKICNPLRGLKYLVPFPTCCQIGNYYIPRKQSLGGI